MNSDQITLLERASNFYLNHLKNLDWEFVARIGVGVELREQLKLTENLEKERYDLVEATRSLNKLFESQFILPNSHMNHDDFL